MHPLVFRRSLPLLLVGMLIASVGSAAACGNGKLILEDKFETLDPSWHFSQQDKRRTNGPDGLTYRLDPGDAIALLNQSGSYQNYEVCAVFITSIPANLGGFVNVRFWSVDEDHYYWGNVFPGRGVYLITRKQNGKTIFPATGAASFIAKGANATNEVSVSVNGNKGTFSVNGQKLTDFTGQPPEGGSLFGFIMFADKENPGPSDFTLKSIQLREIGTAQPQ